VQGAVAAACGRGSYGLAGAWARAGVVERPERRAVPASFSEGFKVFAPLTLYPLLKPC
jgi:hypothetical protein